MGPLVLLGTAWSGPSSTHSSAHPLQLCSERGAGRAVDLLSPGRFSCMPFEWLTMTHRDLPFPSLARWLAPEILLGGSAHIASDVWAFGTVLWEVRRCRFRGHDALLL